MNKRRILLIIFVLVILIVPSTAYEYYTSPHSISVMPQKKAYQSINKSTDSTNTTTTLSYLGSSETVLIGLDTPKEIGAFEYFGITIFAIKTSQKINSPLTGLTYKINSVYLNYSYYNNTLPSPLKIIYNSSGIENIYRYEYGTSGNYTLRFYVHITPVAEIGILHFLGNSVVKMVTINVKITNGSL